MGSRKVCCHIFRQYAGQLHDLRPLLHLQGLLYHGLEEGLLERDAVCEVITAKVASIIVSPPANDLRGILAAEKAVALLLVDVEILIGIIIVHGKRHVKPNASQSIDHLRHGVRIRHEVVVGIYAGEALYLLHEAVDTAA